MKMTLRQARKIMDMFDADGDGSLQLNEMVSIEEFKQRITLKLNENKRRVKKTERNLLSMSLKKSSNNLRRMSTAELSYLSLKDLDKTEQDVLQNDAKEQDTIIKRGEAIEIAVEEALGGDSEVSVDVWNPWPWTDLLDKIADHYDLESIEQFVTVFDEIDIDCGGTIDTEEMFNVLTEAGVKITEEGVLTLCKMIDEDDDGEIDRDEWRETVDFYLELKEEEKQMAMQRKDSNGDLRANLRAQKLMELGQSARAINKVNGLSRLRRRRTASVKDLMSSSELVERADQQVTIAVRKSQSTKTCIKAVPFDCSYRSGHDSIPEHGEEEGDDSTPSTERVDRDEERSDENLNITF